MCHSETCRNCGKATWAGCGQHVDQVMRGVPKNQRCTCPPNLRASGGRSLLARLLGR